MTWLRDAHAMEEQAEKMLSNTAQRIESYPTFKEKLLQHLEETRRQRELIRTCIDRRGGDTSTLKDLTAKMVGMGQALSGLFVDDEVVKAAMASYTFEHFEIASYRSLIKAAEVVGDLQTAQVAQQLLKEEQAMADWMAAELPAITAEYLVRLEAKGVTAKR
ncbi:MAG: hypothetical protein C0453_08225 [Comamonadaceae bacterium]|nr:hypothetical protein [Comamonadaceae bacterium]